MQTYEVLEKALGLIEREEDWCQFGVGSREGPKCALGAVNFVVHDEVVNFHALKPLHVPAMKALSGVAQSLAGECAVGFNNSHSHVEVCDLFRRAIRAEKAKAGVLVDDPRPIEAPPPVEIGPIRSVVHERTVA